MRLAFSSLKTALDFFLFTSLFIALCAVSMVYQTYYIFHLPSYPLFIWFVFFGSLCSYNFHWYLTPALYGGSYRTKWSIVNKKIHLSLFIIGFIGCAWYCIQLLHHWQWLLATVFITFLYSAPKIPFRFFTHLRKIAVGKTIFLSLVWTHITVILPLLLQNIKWQDEHYIFAVNRFFFIYPVCILFDYRDREEDRKEGIKSMITLLPEKGINILFYSCIIIFVITTITLFISCMALVYCIALFIPGLMVALVYNHSKKITSDYYYYFFLDGILMFSALLLYFFSFSYI